MKNLKIGKKLLISYAIILVLLVIGIFTGIANLAAVRQEVETFYDGPFTAKGTADSINASFEEMQKATYRALSNDSAQITEAAISDAKAAADSIQQLLPTVKQHFLGDAAIVTRLEKYLSELAPMREEVLNLAQQNKNTEAAAYMETNNIPIIEKAQTELTAIITASNDNGENLIAELRATQTRAIIILVILGIVSVIISVFFGTYIAKGITKPVAELELAAEKLSRGELDSVIEYESKDELGNLAQSMRITVSGMANLINDLTRLLNEMAIGNFNIHTQAEENYIGDFEPLLLAIRKMNSELSNTLSQINQSSDQVASGSDQVSAGSQALSQGSTEQASSVEELAATINEISKQVQDTAKNAASARDQSNESSEEITVCNQQMKEMIGAMDEISLKSNEIGKIIKTIEDIAFQTNILALNAAVEAARAGAAGKGFAVVADEVRNLASKSAEASKNTSTLIEDSIKAVEKGTQIANETAESLVKVVDGSKLVAATVDDIANAANAQASSIAQVTQGIDQISSVVQTNSATAEESAAASEELSGQSQLLKGLVNRFKLKKTGTEPTKAAPVSHTPAPSVSTADAFVSMSSSMNSSKY